MKKLVSVITSTLLLAALGTGTVLHSKADMKIETAGFSVSADRTQKPSAYCRNADGSAISHDYSSSDNFCISQYAAGNATIMSYDGLPAYCIGDHLQNAPTSLMQAARCSDIPYDSEEYGPIFRIAASGASSGISEYGLESTDLYYVTQCAIRGFLYGIAPESLAFYDDEGNPNEAMTNEFYRISAAANESFIPFENVIEIDSSGASSVPVYTDSKCYYRYGPYTPYSEYTDLPNYTIELEEAEAPVIISPFSDIISEESKSEFTDGYPFYIYIDSTYNDEINLKIHSEVSITRYNPTVYLSEDQQYQNIFQINITDSDELLTGELKLKNTDTNGDIQLNKKFIADNTEINDLSLISQPRFAVQNEHGKYVCGIMADGKIMFDHFSEEPALFTLTSDSILYVSGLPAGEYKICEISGADGYEAREPEILINNTAELNTCEIINESVTTTTQPVTTPVTTSVSTTEETTTTSSDITVILTTVTYMTNITETQTTETVTLETTENTTPSSSRPSSVKTPSNPRIPYSPKTGESGNMICILLLLFALSGSVIIYTKKF